MYQEFYSKSDLLVWPVLALLIFVMIFVGVLAYVFLGLRDQKKIDEMASLPFVSEQETDTRIDPDNHGRNEPVVTDPAHELQDGRTR